MDTKPIKGIPKDGRGRPSKKWSLLRVGEGIPATSGTAHYQNRMAKESGSKRHYVYRCVSGVGYVFRSK